MKKYIHIPSKQKMPKISYRHSPIMQDTPNRFELKDLMFAIILPI